MNVKFASDWRRILFECSGLGLSFGECWRVRRLSVSAEVFFVGKERDRLITVKWSTGAGSYQERKQIILESARCPLIRLYVRACAGP